MGFKLLAYIIIWTIMRETLLDKYWRYSDNRHLFHYGNLYVIIACILLTIGVAVI